MKKEILLDDEDFLDIKYIISKNKYAIYTLRKKDKLKWLAFFYKGIKHRNCNIGPQYRDDQICFYQEKGKIHNLYGPAMVKKYKSEIRYVIKYTEYKLDEFNKYISIYNQLSYKRNY